MDEKISMGYLNKYIKRYRKGFGVALIFIVLETFSDLLQPTIMSKIIDNGVKNNDLNYVMKLGGIMLLMTGFGAICAIIRNIVSSKVSQNFGSDLREDLYIKIQNFSFENMDNFHDASLITRLTNDVNQVQNFGHGMMRIFVKAPIIAIGSIILSALINPRMSLILIGIIPIVGIIIFINMKISYPIFGKIQLAVDKVNGAMREFLAGIRVVKAFNRFDYEKHRFKDVNKNLSDTTVGGMRTIAVFSPLISVVVNLGIVLVLWIGGYNVNSGAMEVGQIMAFINYMTQILFSLIMLSRILSVFIRARASAERIGEVFQQENTIIGKKEIKESQNIQGQIEFQNVSFHYKNIKNPALEDISFNCKIGETLGIIGSTGSGKSTLINLIPRFYDVTKGSIKIDGINIKDLDVNTLRDNIAIVPQKTLLFTGSIIENIRWGKENATMEEIEEVTRITNSHEFIESFNEKYDTYLGQGGVNLSGGQKQRIAIARALIKKPKILILDDSTSAVDVVTERSIREGLKVYLKDTTTILIAQRITSVIDADRILVLDKGKIVCQGNHNELMDSCQVYQDIFHSQIGKGVVLSGTTKK